MPESRVDNLSDTKGKWLKATCAFGGGMKLFRGHIDKQYTPGVYTGMEFVQEEAIKPKTGDIWRITPGGYKSLSDVNALAEDYGFYRDLLKYGNTLIMPADDYLLAGGVITEKVKLSMDQEFSHNRVAVLTLNGMNFDDLKYEIFILPYSASTVVSGMGQDGHLSSLFVPLNAPTTIPALKPLLWKDRKDYFTFMRFSDDCQLVDSVGFRGELMWGEFQILEGQDASFVLGRGDGDFDGWFRGVVKKINAFQITKIKDGKVVYNTLIDEDMIESNLKPPGGDKAKFKMEPYNSFDEIIELPNGDALVTAHNYIQLYAFQLSPEGEFKAMYLMEVGEDEKVAFRNYQYTIKDGQMILVANSQPLEFSTDAKVETNVHTSKGAYVTTTTTTTTVKKLNEVYMQSIVWRLNPETLSLSEPIEFDGKEFYTMGSFPAIITEDAFFFAGREKGPKGKKIYVVKVDI